MRRYAEMIVVEFVGGMIIVGIILSASLSSVIMGFLPRWRTKT